MFSQVCQTLTSQASNKIAFSQTLSDFIILLSTEKYNFIQMASDPQLPEFLSLCISPFYQLSINSEPDFLKFLNNVMIFLEKLFSFHPAFITYTAKSFEFDYALFTLSQMSDDLFSRTYIDFISHLSFVPDLQIKNPKKCLDSLIELYQKSINKGPLIFTFVGLIRNSPSVNAALKTTSYFAIFQNIVNENISTDDHFCVISSLSALISLFPGSIDDNTAKLAAQHALSVSNDSLILLHSAIWIFEDLALSSKIEPEDLSPILSLALESPSVKAFHLFEAINYIIANSPIPLISKNNFSFFEITPIVSLLFSQENGFLSRSVIRLIQQVFEIHPKILESLENIEEIVMKSLKVISSPLMTTNPDYLDCILVSLRFLLGTPTTFEKAKQTLLSYEEQLFVAFQRNIETNNGFAALNLYIFISQCSKNIPSWERRLQFIIADSQFGALLAHVLENSTDRRVICDGIQVISQISNKNINFNHFSMVTSSQTANTSILFDSIISGFIIINSQNKKVTSETNEKNLSIISQQQEKIRSLQGQTELNELEIVSLSKKLEESQIKNENLNYQIQTLIDQKEEQKSQIDSLNDDQNEKNQEIQDLKDKIQILNQTIEKLNMKIETQEHDNDALQKQLEKFENIQMIKDEVEKEKVKLECAKETSAKQLQDLESTIRKLTSANETYKEKLKELKTISETQKSQIDEANHEKEKNVIIIKQTQEIVEQKQKIIENVQKKYQNLKAKLREIKQAYDAIRLREVELSSQNEKLQQNKRDIEKELFTLKKEKKDWEILIEFMHRITDDDHPPSEQLIGLMSDL